VRGEQKVELYSRDSISFESAGRPIITPQRNEWTFTVRDSVPAESLYLVCVASFLRQDRDNALSALNDWKRGGYNAELIERGRGVQIGRRLVDNRVYTLSVGAYPDRVDAQRERERLAEAGIEGWIE
jgi:hypothetical protein